MKIIDDQNLEEKRNERKSPTLPEREYSRPKKINKKLIKKSTLIKHGVKTIIENGSVREELQILEDLEKKSEKCTEKEEGGMKEEKKLEETKTRKNIEDLLYSLALNDFANLHFLNYFTFNVKK